MMRKRYFRASGMRRHISIIVSVLVLVMGCIGVFAVYHVLNPFQSLNPLYHEVTVGEKVIDDWKYDGKNQAGYLVFVNTDEVQHLLPPESKELALDGKYVVIEEATPNALTYAEPVESYSFPWVLLGLIPIGVIILLLILKRRGRKMKLSPARRHSFHKSYSGQNAQLLRMKSRIWLRRRMARWRR